MQDISLAFLADVRNVRVSLKKKEPYVIRLVEFQSELLD
jgi:hypothetical protein